MGSAPAPPWEPIVEMRNLTFRQIEEGGKHHLLQLAQVW